MAASVISTTHVFQSDIVLGQDGRRFCDRRSSRIAFLTINIDGIMETLSRGV